MSGGEIAGLIAAVAFVALVALTAVPLLKLGRVLEEVRLAVRDIGHESVPILTELRGTVRATNDELVKLSMVTEDAAKVSRNATVVSENAAQMTQLFSATLGGPLVKTAAFSYGIRKAIKGNGSAPQGEAERVMFRRLFWFVIGAGVAVFVYTKVRQYMKKASPEAIGHRVAESASGHQRVSPWVRRPGTSRDGGARNRTPRDAQPAR